MPFPAVTGIAEPPQPMEPAPWPAAFDDAGWLWQVKWDGIRALAASDGTAVRLWSRHGRPITAAFPELTAELAEALGGRRAVLDGEVVALGNDGRPSFHLVLSRMRTARPDPGLGRRIPVVYAVFDALGWEADLRGVRIEERLARVESLRPTAHVRPVGHTHGDGRGFCARVAAAGLEGAVAKRPGSRYRAGRCDDWRKVKQRRTLTALVAGAKTAGPGGRIRSLALTLAAAGELVYIGDVGAGLTEPVRDRLRALLAEAPPWTPPFPHPPAGTGEARLWIAPRWTARVSFAEYTPQGLLRAPVLLGFGGPPDHGASDPPRLPPRGPVC